MEEKTKEHEVAKYALKEIVTTHEEKQKEMVNEHKKQEEAKIDLQKQLDAERKKLADLEKIAKEKSQTKISIKMPEASADGSATDKYLQNFADNKPEATQPVVTNPETTSMPIHLKITSENG